MNAKRERWRFESLLRQKQHRGGPAKQPCDLVLLATKHPTASMKINRAIVMGLKENPPARPSLHLSR